MLPIAVSNLNVIEFIEVITKVGHGRFKLIMQRFSAK